LCLTKKPPGTWGKTKTGLGGMKKGQKDAGKRGHGKKQNPLGCEKEHKKKGSRRKK